MAAVDVALPSDDRFDAAVDAASAVARFDDAADDAAPADARFNDVAEAVDVAVADGVTAEAPFAGRARGWIDGITGLPSLDTR